MTNKKKSFHRRVKQSLFKKPRPPTLGRKAGESRQDLTTKPNRNKTTTQREKPQCKRVSEGGKVALKPWGGRKTPKTKENPPKNTRKGGGTRPRERS